MKRGVNTVILIGNVGQDPETRHFPNGGAVTNVSLATSETWKDKQTGEQKEKTEWHRLVFRDRGAYPLGAIAGEHITKGAKLYVSGSLQTRKWQDQSGVDRYTTEIVVDEFQFLSERQQQGSQQQGEQGAPHAAPQAGTGSPDFEDNIPF